jgi:glutamyl-tRNA synthetase
MNITHVIRGDDHISNTPKQILLYQALNFTVPEFAHLPLIMGTEGGRLSKRTGATAISDYRKMGYLPQALVNYLLLLSWSPGGDRELVTLKEAVGLFDIKNVNKTAATFNLKKLQWINNQYLKNADPEKLADEIIPQLIEAKYIEKDNFDRNYLVSLVKLFQARLNTLSDFPGWADFFFLKEIAIDPEAEKKHLSQDLSKEFSAFIKRLDSLKDFDIAAIEAEFRGLVAELGIEAKTLIHPIRVALTGKTIGPGLFEVIHYLGRERTKQRLNKFIKKE